MDHTIALIRRAHEGDENARAQLVEENTGLIWCVVKRFYGRGTEAEDLFQIGSIGLLKAIDKFDLGYDVKFSTYAVPMITGEIKRYLRDQGMIKVSRSLKEINAKAYRVHEALFAESGREPGLEEIAEKIAVTREELVMAMEAGAQIEYLQKMIFFIKRSKISSGDVFLTIRMQVAVSATTDFKCNIIFFRQQSGKFFL